MPIDNVQKPVVLITGSSGLIGTRIARNFQGDYRVIGFDLEPTDESVVDGWAHCDLTSDDSVHSALDYVRSHFGTEIASVIHLAAYYDFSGEPSPLYEELTVEGTRRLLEGLRAFQVEQFNFSSSLLVMKSSESGEPVSAESPVEAEWDYPRSKLQAEAVIRECRGEIPAAVLRLAGVYDADCHSIPIAQQISRIHQKQLESYFYPGDSSHGQAFIHLDDVVGCYRATVERRNRLATHEVLVIGEEDVMSYAELQDTIGELIHGQEWPTIRIPKFAAKAGAWIKDQLASEDDPQFIKPWMVDLADQNYPVSLERARAVLGWEPQHTLRRTLPEIISRLNRDPQRWYEVNNLPVPDEYKHESAAARSS